MNTKLTSALMAAGCLLLGACATMSNPGYVESGQDGVKRAPVRLRGIPADAVVTRDGSTLDLSATRQRYYELVRKFCTEAGASVGRVQEIKGANDKGAQDLVQDFEKSFPANCDYAGWPYTANMLLPTDKPTVFRVRSGAREATLTAEAGTQLKWVWLDGFFPFIGWIVDGMTGKWTYFGDDLDVGRALKEAGTAQR